MQEMRARVIETIFPRIYARTYYAPPSRARVVSFSAREAGFLCKTLRTPAAAHTHTAALLYLIYYSRISLLLLLLLRRRV